MRNRTKYRILEIIPGAMVWTTLIGLIVLSFVNPLWAIYFIIVFDVYWVIRVFYMLIHLIHSWARFRKDEKIGWMSKLKQEKNGEWQKIYHLLVLPFSTEPLEVLQATFREIAKVDYPLDRFIIVLSGEWRNEENFRKNAEAINKEFGDKFFKFIITMHPKDLPDELAGKGANANWAGHRAKEFIDQQKILYENIIVSNFDIDTCPHRQYFSYLTFSFLTNPNSCRASYQPIAVYNNNIWESPALVRIVHNSTTFWLFTDLARPERLFTFSSHSMSFKALVDVGFWDKTIVTEDSRICLQGIVRYNGDYKVIPMYIQVSMDTAYEGTFWGSMKNQYKQIRRWAYGVENFPYMAWNMWGNKKIKFLKKFRYLWNQLEGVYSWATAPILIFILGWLPLKMLSDDEKTSILAQNAPIILKYLMTVAMAGLLVSAILSITILPARPQEHKFYKYSIMFFQWILFPYCMIIFGSIPAIDAQTRLMLGKYMGFNVTKKKGGERILNSYSN
ncbi:glycosyltransferase family 2 protein [Candidatus Parcubacteria bacterium]|nr:glycosyltransferase family 2 protein [Candidatus Parcubacteria bacterium]